MTKDAKKQAASSQPFFVMMPQPIAEDDEISVIEVLRMLANNKWIILFITLMFTVGAIAYALQLTPIYRAETLVMPAQKDDRSTRLGGLASRLEGLASLAGVSLPVGSDIETVLATLRSRRFLSGFINHHNLKPILFSDSWDSEQQRWLVAEPSIISRIKSRVSGTETRKLPEQLNNGEPSIWSSYSLFANSIFTIKRDNNSGLVTIQIDWKDPNVAAEWANSLVHRLNAELRQQVIAESERGIAYLKAQIHETSLADLRTVLYRIIEDHTKNITLAKVNEEYALKIIDPAVPPQQRIKPKRSQIVLLGCIIGIIVGVLIAFLRGFNQQSRSSVEQETPEQEHFEFR